MSHQMAASDFLTYFLIAVAKMPKQAANKLIFRLKYPHQQRPAFVTAVGEGGQVGEKTEGKASWKSE